MMDFLRYSIFFSIVNFCQTFDFHEFIFANAGQVHKNDIYVFKELPCIYLESQNVTTLQNNWIDQGKHRYLFQWKNNVLVPPPSGMRSAIPLGGISTGNIELRADGSFHEWTIMNQTPAGAAKFQIINEAIFAISETYNNNTVTLAMRTSPPSGVIGIESIIYSGAYPLSLLKIKDSRFNIDIELYAYSTFYTNDLPYSATPAITFTFQLTNPTNKIVDLDLLMNLPTFERNYKRTSEQTGKGGLPIDAVPFKIVNDIKSDINCMQQCNSQPSCKTWTFLQLNMSCWLYDTVNLNTYSYFHSSGLKSEWVYDEISNMRCLSSTKPGKMAPNGNTSICVPNETRFSYMTGNNLNIIMNDFHYHNMSGKISNDDINGAISIGTNLKPGERRQLKFIMSWYYPNRDFINKIYGNFYSKLFHDSLHAAKLMIDREEHTLNHLLVINRLFYDSSLPIWLADVYVNSLSHIRSAMWFENGVWRQWEANDCTNIDSVHNDGERHIPYIMFFPQSVRQKIFAWAKSQLSNGMIPEQLRCNASGPDSDIDKPCGRIMSDVSSMFIVYVLEMYQWNNDVSLLLELYPVIRKAADWHLKVSSKYGIPLNLQNTYDILNLNKYSFSTYNSAFHLLAMKASKKLATIVNDVQSAIKYDKAYKIGLEAINKYLWNSTMHYYNSYSTINGSNFVTDGAIMTDSFYAQVLASSIGLGWLVDEKRLKQHLTSEYSINNTPYGMLVQTGRYSAPGPWQDNAIWQMGNPNWATNMIRLSKSNYKKALRIARVTLDRWRMIDGWNVAGVTGGIGYGAEGQPYITSHYGYYMSSWHILLALTGQQYDSIGLELTFNPVYHDNSDFKLPLILPGRLATISQKKVNNKSLFQFNFIFGSKICLRKISVRESTYLKYICLNSGEFLTWST